MDELLHAHDGDIAAQPEGMKLDAAIQALAAFVEREPSEHTALELLAIDGLATGAFVDVGEPGRLVALADRACAELMALGDGGA